ncbi:MAG: hypothetical protein ONB44_08740 [candidate division KSB1 bacterium]|nr:hypothetical protein [candidate division KSB1 bacterium]
MKNYTALQVRQNNVSAERLKIIYSARQAFGLAGKAEHCSGRTIEKLFAKQSSCLNPMQNDYLF